MKSVRVLENVRLTSLDVCHFGMPPNLEKLRCKLYVSGISEEKVEAAATTLLAIRSSHIWVVKDNEYPADIMDKVDREWEQWKGISERSARKILLWCAFGQPLLG